MKAILFDLDGTLIDSQGDVLAAFAEAFRGLGRPLPPREELLAVIGRRLEDCFVHFVGGDGAQGARLFRSHYEGHCLDTTRPFPSVDGALRRLAGERRLAVCSMKKGEFTRRIVRAMGWEGLFRSVLGSEEGYAPKPEPDMALELCRRLSVHPGEAALVGDTALDGRMADAAGLGAFYFVSWGYGKPESLDGVPVSGVLDSAEDLLEVLLGDEA